MITVELSTLSREGKWLTKEIACLRPHPGDDILTDGEEFRVNAVALVAGEAKALANVTHRSRKGLSARVLAGMGFTRDEAR